MNIKKKTIFVTTVLMAMGASVAQAAYTPVVTTTGNNLTVIGANNGLTGGSNDVIFTWDGTFRASVVTDGSYNATLSSPTTFAGAHWTAHNMNVYAPGNYIFYTGCSANNPACGIGPAYNLAVGSGQVGAHMLVNWMASTNIDIVLLWDGNKSWGQTGTASPFSTNTPNQNGNSMNTVWDGVSIDVDGDTWSGAKLIDGSFVGQSANFNVNGIHAAPIPTSLWLLGSGLLGLVGVARRKAT